jgi:hypothetical protein
VSALLRRRLERLETQGRERNRPVLMVIHKPWESHQAAIARCAAGRQVNAFSRVFVLDFVSALERGEPGILRRP